MHVIGSILGRAIAIIAVFAAFAVLRKYVPIRPETGDDKKSVDDLEGQFNTARWLFPLCMVFVGILFAWATHAGLVWLNRYLAEKESPGALQLLLPQSAIWWFFPGFAALTFAYELTLQLWSIFGSRQNADRYSDWTNLKTANTSGLGRIDYRKSLRWMFLLVAAPTGAFTVLALPMHASLGPESIHDCGYAFSSCKIYPYTAARRMTIIQGFRRRDGSFTSRAGAIVDFDGGRRWSSADIGNFRHNVDSSIVQILQAKTHLSIQSAETEADILPLNSKQ
jgi:hypothetical protein